MADQVYEAQVQMLDESGNWIDKLASNGAVIQTSMFPNNWNYQRIMNEVAFAFKNKIASKKSAVHFEGTCGNEIKVIFVIDDKRIVQTVYPIK